MQYPYTFESSNKPKQIKKYIIYKSNKTKTTTQQPMNNINMTQNIEKKEDKNKHGNLHGKTYLQN